MRHSPSSSTYRRNAATAYFHVNSWGSSLKMKAADRPAPNIKLNPIYHTLRDVRRKDGKGERETAEVVSLRGETCLFSRGFFVSPHTDT